MTVDAWSVVRHIHHYGSPITGRVTSLQPFHSSCGSLDLDGYIHLETTSQFPAVLRYSDLVNDPADFDVSKLPSVGNEVDTVVRNFVENTLILSARPYDLSKKRINQWQRYYEYIETLKMGDEITGTVTRVRPFGLFVDIGSEFRGLIDIGHNTWLVSTPQLPYDPSQWPQVGDPIRCKIEYLRLHGQKIGLGWLPGCVD
ncbi:MAG: S1 RNA-binding domain-containing protein [Cyanobacteria bacterium P01_E01_bin.34]